MTIDEFKALHPTQVQFVPMANSWYKPGLIKEGMLEFTDDSSFMLASPFADKYGYFRVVDHSKLDYGRPLPSIAEYKQKIRFWRSNFPFQHYLTHGNPFESEEHLQVALSKLTTKELNTWSLNLTQNLKSAYEIPLKERPYSFYLCGTDDSSWTLYTDNFKELTENLELIEKNQPLDLSELIKDFGFVFTN